MKPGRRQKVGLWGGLLVVGLLAAPPAMAKNHALVVGVSDYPALDSAMQLRGPANDAELVRDFLLGLEQRSFPRERVEVLADGVEGAATPTRSAILGALERIAERTEPGDFIYLHFSGHGSRAPAKDPQTETDGLDELFLPGDIGQWDDAIGAVDNSLVDDQIGERITAIRDRGGFVWVVFDSCHSGTVTRGAPTSDGVRYRKVEPGGLGIPRTALDRAAASAPRTRGRDRAAPEGSLDRAGDASGQGGYVAFYAAQSTQTTPELRLPAGQPGRQSHGLFTFTLMEVLARNPSLTYRQLGQEVLHHYAADRRRPTPLFEGDLDARAFGARQAATPRQWPVRQDAGGQLRVAAGELHGLREGMRLPLLSSPAAATEERIGMLEVVSTSPLESMVKRVSAGEGPRADQAQRDIPDGAYARLDSRAVDFRLRVARPDLGPAEGSDRARKVAEALSSLKPAPDTGLRLVWTDPEEPADVRLAFPLTETTAEAPRIIDDSRLWLLPPSGEVETEGPMRTPAIRLADKDAQELAAALADNLARMARVTNLLRVGRHMGPAAMDVAVTLRLKRSNGEFEPIAAERVPTVHPGDEIHIAVRNPTDRAVDVNVLFVGSDYSISHMGNDRIHAEGELKRGLLRVTDSSFGQERILVIATPGRKHTQVQDLSFLEQAALPRTRGKGSDGPPLHSMLRQAGFGHRSRGAAALGGAEDGPTGAIMQFSVQTRPATAREDSP